MPHQLAGRRSEPPMSVPRAQCSLVAAAAPPRALEPPGPFAHPRLFAGATNSGKTALFNALTGAHQKVANYAGVTVERRKEGRIHAVEL